MEVLDGRGRRGVPGHGHDRLPGDELEVLIGAVVRAVLSDEDPGGETGSEGTARDVDPVRVRGSVDSIAVDDLERLDVGMGRLALVHDVLAAPLARGDQIAGAVAPVVDREPFDVGN